MRLKQCKHCGAAFETSNSGAYLCPNCAGQSRRSSVYRDRICVDCGAVFKGYPKSKRCPECQKAANRESSRRNKKNGSARPLGSVDQCQRCGAEYVVVAGTQRYCKTCASDAVADNVRSHKRQYNAANKDSLYAAKADNRSYNKICVVCGSVFDADTATVTCSPECAAIRRKQLQQDADKRRSPRNREKR